MLIKDTFNAWIDDNVSIHSAALAYYTFFSLPPLLIIIINIAGAVFGVEAVQSSVMDQLDGLMGQGGTEMIEEMIAKAQRPKANILSTGISIVTLLVGAIAVFKQLQTSLNIIWDAPRKVATGIWGFFRKYILSFGILVSTGFLLLVSLVLSAVLQFFSHYLSQSFPGMDVLWKLADLVISVVVIGALFSLIFKVLPNLK
ncbi:MAG TPA: YhjD/YihY/BrkB family envelope integrity protein, partial [Chitinispirillaceae bacterium]|nr:YhjD/YihY/BrkB family envelope integrity protein [Chitinispirillaceae bacterium]